MLGSLLAGLSGLCFLYLVLKLHQVWEFVLLQKSIKGQVIPVVQFQKILDKEDNFDWFLVTESFSMTIKFYLDDDGVVHTRIFGVPQFYITNFISCPRILWPIIPPHGRGSIAACVHDFLYEKHYHRVELPKNYDYRRLYDIIFLAMLVNSNLPNWQCFVMYAYVRAFGWVTFKKKP